LLQRTTHDAALRSLDDGLAGCAQASVCRRVFFQEDPDLAELIATATRTARRFKADSRGAKGAGHSLYLALLEDRRRACRFGLYVGQTSRDPDLRFDQHKTGYKASRAVTRFGVRLLPEVVEHLNPLRGWEALELEAALAEALSRAGVAWVEGGH
jgi:hypothetical protein